jgi:predicted membrane chloride channel (bestrophin family)
MVASPNSRSLYQLNTMTTTATSTNTSNSYRAIARSLWSVLFQLDGSQTILFAVLPYCIINCVLLALVELSHQEIGFSPTGHGLLTLLVSFLVIQKVNLAYERFMMARQAAGNAFLHLRELVQLIVAISEGLLDNDEDKALQKWRSECVDKVVELIDATKSVLQNENVARYLARNESSFKGPLSDVIDPMELAQSLRIHLYLADFQLLERVSLLNKLSEFVADYRQLLNLASTPIPIPLVQMGRAFLFLWTFSMPLVLRQGPFTDLLTAEVFLFFLTYGFVGLELVSMRLSHPFGDDSHDIKVSGLRDATIVGIESDLRGLGRYSISQRRLRFRIQKSAVDDVHPSDNRYNVGGDQLSVYHAMSGSDMC